MSSEQQTNSLNFVPVFTPTPVPQINPAVSNAIRWRVSARESVSSVSSASTLKLSSLPQNNQPQDQPQDLTQTVAPSVAVDEPLQTFPPQPIIAPIVVNEPLPTIHLPPQPQPIIVAPVVVNEPLPTIPLQTTQPPQQPQPTQPIIAPVVVNNPLPTIPLQTTQPPQQPQPIVVAPVVVDNPLPTIPAQPPLPPQPIVVAPVVVNNPLPTIPAQPPLPSQPIVVSPVVDNNPFPPQPPLHPLNAPAVSIDHHLQSTIAPVVVNTPPALPPQTIGTPVVVNNPHQPISIDKSSIPKPIVTSSQSSLSIPVSGNAPIFTPLNPIIVNPNVAIADQIMINLRNIVETNPLDENNIIELVTDVINTVAIIKRGKEKLTSEEKQSIVIYVINQIIQEAPMNDELRMFFNVVFIPLVLPPLVNVFSEYSISASCASCSSCFPCFNK